MKELLLVLPEVMKLGSVHWMEKIISESLFQNQQENSDSVQRLSMKAFQEMQ